MRRKTWIGLAVAVTLTSVVASAATKTYVLPVVVRGVAGADGSFWDSEVRILSVNPDGPLTVRRVWVATKDGGFVDDPNTAPRWVVQKSSDPGLQGRMFILPGSSLHRDLAILGVTHAAVGLEIEGEAAVFIRNANTEAQPRLPSDGGFICCLPGNGQLTKAATEYLQGESFIPWATGGTEAFRTNLGFINPSDKPLHLEVRLMAMWPLQAGPVMSSTFMWYDKPAAGFSPTIVLDLPPWGWRQLNDIFQNLKLCDGNNNCAPSQMTTPTYARIIPQGTQPYLAYASVVYSPKNDPEFIWAEPGSLGTLPTSAK